VDGPDVARSHPDPKRPADTRAGRRRAPRGPTAMSAPDPHPYGAPAPLTPSEDRLWASLTHFLAILIVPTFIVWLVFRERGRFTDQEGKEATNWTINVTGALVILNVLQAIFVVIPILGILISLLLGLVIFAVVVVNIVFAIIGGTRVQSGRPYRYPLNIRWIK
jgi:uncharacterized Tic20 family protein